MTDEQQKAWEAAIECLEYMASGDIKITFGETCWDRLRLAAKEGICECGADAKQCAENREHHKIHLNRMGGE